MRNLVPNDCLSWEERARLPKKREAIYDPPQPMPRPHEHLKCHWLPKFFPLSSLIYSNPYKFYSIYPVINPEIGVSATTTTNY
jgi:hypothetical protein